MMQMTTMRYSVPPLNVGGGSSSCREKEWELRPGGMLVQTRTDTEQNPVAPPTIRVRVKHGSICHEIRISPQATYGELKKMLSVPTGLHHHDQKLFYKDKERDSKAFLDTSGVKDKSKIVLHEDPISREKRYLENRKNAVIEKAAKSVSEISLVVDRLARQVSTLESVISKSGKVSDKRISDLVDTFMNQLLRLEGIVVADGTLTLQKETQEGRVQKCVETLDLLKIKNSTRNGEHFLVLTDSPVNSAPGGSRVITTQWETFDSAVDGPSTVAGPAHKGQSSFTWDLL